MSPSACVRWSKRRHPLAGPDENPVVTLVVGYVVPRGQSEFLIHISFINL